MGNVVRKEPCPNCRKNGQDTSGDNLIIYDNGGGAYCWACRYYIPSDNHSKEEPEFEDVMTEFTKEDHDKLKKITTYKAKGLRGIKDETYKKYGVRHAYNEETGLPSIQYTPNTENYVFCGYKARVLPKEDWFTLGKNGKTVDLFGQYHFKDFTGKYVLITAGEVDCLSGFDMLRNYQVSKGNSDYAPIPVVSPTTGEGSSAKQLQAQYDWLDRFERIILCFDNDEAGKEAVQAVLKVLPRGKVYIVNLALKDTNKYLEEGRQKEWVAAFYNARKYAPDGVTTSMDLEQKMLEYVSLARISLPPFMHKLQKMLCGGIPMECIVNIVSASGTGKSTFADAMILHWIMETGYKVGIVSLEASEGEYGVNLSSSYCKFKLNLIENTQERIDYLLDPENIAKRKQLWEDENGDPRFYLVDSDVETLQAKVEYLVISLGCKIIVLDPLQDIFDALGDDEQAKFMKWQKDLKKREQMTFININHVRKSGQDQKANSTGVELYEESIMGSSTIFKSGAINLILMRNKEAEDAIDRNTTRAKITKARGIGHTGPAGSYYYDNTTHQLHDKEDWLEVNNEEF